MQIVIEISDTLKKIIDSHDIQTASHPMWVATMIDAIENGQTLPKGHGALKDTDALIKLYGLEDATKYGNESAEQQTHSYSTMMMYEIADMLADAPTIIEADTVSEGEE